MPLSDREPILLPVSIALNQSLSEAIDLANLVPIAIIMPAAWTAANLTFQAADRPEAAGAYQNVYDDNGVEVTVVAAVSRYIPLTTFAQEIQRLRWIKVRSGTSGAAVVQLAARVLQIVCRRV